MSASFNPFLCPTPIECSRESVYHPNPKSYHSNTSKNLFMNTASASPILAKGTEPLSPQLPMPNQSFGNYERNWMSLNSLSDDDNADLTSPSPFSPSLSDSLSDDDIESGDNLRVSISVGTVFNDGMSDDNCDTHDDVNGQQTQSPAPPPFLSSLMLLVNPSIRGRTRLMKGMVEHQFLPLLVNVVQVPLESFFFFFFPFPYYSVAVEPVTPLSPAQRKRKLSTGAKTLSHTRKNFY